ncbi:MAG TPA: replication initiator [Propionibacteriaceae bacterium]|nr:replication initiator [Propionibacteriaceae bacterium]
MWQRGPQRSEDTRRSRREAPGLDADSDARPAHVLRFGVQLDAKGLIAPSENADRAVRYLTKYLAKNISDTYPDTDHADAAYQAHIDRLHEEGRWLPCTPGCANWLRYGIQPANPGPGLIPGRCANKAHDRENLGLGGRRVLVSRQWSGKTLTEHKADRATVVREALTTAGIEPPELDRMAASVTLPDGSPRFVWTDTRPDADIYARVILASVLERQQWRTLLPDRQGLPGTCGSLSATGQPP